MLFSKTNTYYFVISAGIIMTSLLCTLCLEYDSVSAYTASITTNDSISFDISPSGDGTSVHSESINVQSDCRAGYNLTIATPEGSSLYKYENNTQAGTASFTAVDGTSALNNSNNTNKWGYTLTTNPTSSTVFLPLSSTQAVLKTSSQTASLSSDINDTFDINYGAKVSDSVDPGTYQMANNGAIVYYLTMDTTCTQYTVSFNANGGTGTMDNQEIEAGEPIKLTSADSLTAPTGASYTDADNNTITGDPDKLWTFWGWNTSADGTGDWYKDKEAVENLTSVGSTITLYAQWKQATLVDLTVGTPVTTEKVINHNEMQDMSPETCYNSTAYSTDTSSDAHNPYDASTNPNGYHTITLLDYRGKVTTGESPEQPESYTVSKLPDNLCWMTKDLNLGRESGGANNDGTVTLTSDDTDLADGTTFTLPVSPTTYITSSTGYRTPQILINHTVTSYTVNSVSYSPTIGHYSWAAATATNTSISASGEVTTSICPKNWDLPTRMQFYNLRSKGSVTSATIAHEAPYNFVYGGYRNAANGYYNQTSYGYYWTSGNSSSNYGYWSYVYSSGIYNGSTSSGYKHYGAKLRCVVSNGTATIHYDGNGTTEYPVTGTTAAQTNVEINTTNTMANGFTRTSWTFRGWNTQADGSGISIAANASISTLNLKPGETITLYAQWLPQYIVTYVNNCQTYASANSSCTQTVSDDTSEQKINLANDPSTGIETGTLAAYNKWTLTGWKIKEWTTNADGTGTAYPVASTYTVPSGSSIGSGITLYAHWIPVYSIQYDGNGASNPNGMGTTDQNTGEKSVKQTNVGQGDPVTLLASNFKKSGYGFAGWSTSPTATIGGTDKIYGPMETIDAPAYPNDGTSIITMYAVWIPVEKNGSNNPVYLQDFTTSDCNALTSTNFNTSTGVITPGSVIALTDKRDNQIYTIAKLADNNCWMVENLRLNNQYTMGQNQNDSNVTNQSLSQGYGGTTGTYGNFVGLAATESANFSDTTTSLGFADGGIYKSSLASPTDTYNVATRTLEDIGTTNYPGYRFPRYNNSNNSSALSSPTFTENYANASSPSISGAYKASTVSSYGNYYTWAAAMANTSRYTNYAISEFSGTSICPSNWHLPSSNGTTKEYGALSQSYGGTGGDQSGVNARISNRFRTFPNNFLLPGYFENASARDRGSIGVYWSRSVYDDSRSFHLHMNVYGISPSRFSSYSKFYGASVRCLINTSLVEVILDNNDGTGSATRVYSAPGESVDLPQPTRIGYKVKWNTAANGSGIEYATSYTIPSGLSGITLYAQWLPVYSVQYDGNGADNPNGMGIVDGNGVKNVRQINVAEGDSIALLASNFKRTGYGFAGWSTDSNAWAHFIDNDNTNDPIIYGPMETIVAPVYPGDGTNIVTMYAVWVEAEKDGSDNPVYLQDFTTSDCNALAKADFNTSTGVITPGGVIALTDKRDNQVYTVAKLADNKCWMVENLRLEHSGTVGNNINDNSVTNQSLSQGYGGTTGTYGEFVGLADPESTNFSNSTVPNSVYKSDGSGSVFDSANNTLEDIGTSGYPGYRFPRYNSDNTLGLVDSPNYIQDYANAPNLSATGTFPTANIYSYGNYYTWTAAVANTNHYDDTYYADTSTSICPTHWHLPSGGSASREFGYLSQSYGGTGSTQIDTAQSGDIMSNRFRAFPNNFLRSGNIVGSSKSRRGGEGYYWSGTISASAYNLTSSYFMNLSYSYIYPSVSDSQSLGLSVRCLISS